MLSRKLFVDAGSGNQGSAVVKVQHLQMHLTDVFTQTFVQMQMQLLQAKLTTVCACVQLLQAKLGSFDICVYIYLDVYLDV